MSNTVNLLICAQPEQYKSGGMRPLGVAGKRMKVRRQGHERLNVKYKVTSHNIVKA